MLKILFEGSLLGDSPFIACVSDSEHPIIGLTLTYGFILFSVVLLLNMIIAMMSKAACLDAPPWRRHGLPPGPLRAQGSGPMLLDAP